MKRTSSLIITVDGPAGSGKSTVARKLASKLGFVHLNSGWLFRAVAYEALRRGVNFGEGAALAQIARELQFEFAVDAVTRETQFTVNGENWKNLLGSAEVGNAASEIAVQLELREVLAEVQRAVGKRFSLVIEGRDAGTVIFPYAAHKFFLDASLKVRAERRFKELVERGEKRSFEDVMREMQTRDERDSSREIAPTAIAPDAEVVDTSELSVDQVVERLFARVVGTDKGLFETCNTSKGDY